MNVIFLDVDGVLNHSYFNEKYIMNSLINPDSDDIRIDEANIKVLSNICKQTNSKVVLSSSWKLSIDEFGNYTKQLKELISLFNKYNIELYGITPNIPNPNHVLGQRMWKEYDIKEYLKNHNEITNYCIIDDETYDLESLKEYLVLTDSDYFGILPSHLNEIKRILKQI